MEGSDYRRGEGNVSVRVRYSSGSGKIVSSRRGALWKGLVIVGEEDADKERQTTVVGVIKIVSYSDGIV